MVAKKVIWKQNIRQSREFILLRNRLRKRDSGETGTDLVKGLANFIVNEGVVSTDWEISSIVNIYKGMGDALERGNYRGLK